MKKPFVKWAGGKEKELNMIIPNLPSNIDDFYEPFVGGGAVYFSLSNFPVTGNKYINDKSDELIKLYKNISSNSEEFFRYLDQLNYNWGLLDNVIEKNKNTLMNMYKKYKDKNKNLQQLKDSISAFIYSHRDDFNGMLNETFNAYIEEFHKAIVKSVSRKIKRVVQLSSNVEFTDDEVLQNILTAFKSAFYTHFRKIYNDRVRNEELSEIITDKKASAIFYFLREFCYASMFRYNKKGDFNVPYGGMAYNDKSFSNKINQIKDPKYQEYIKNTIISNNDFETFMKESKPKKGDFIFLDPPYDTEFSEYAKNSFGKEDQKRLAEYLSSIESNFMLVIKSTPFIKSLYENKGFNIIEFDKKYMVNFQNRNERSVVHLMIMNY